MLTKYTWRDYSLLRGCQFLLKLFVGSLVFSRKELSFAFRTGMNSTNKLCQAGYFCRGNATSATPNQGEDANICPIGKYCPEGTGEPNACPKGSFSNMEGILAYFASVMPFSTYRFLGSS